MICANRPQPTNELIIHINMCSAQRMVVNFCIRPFQKAYLQKSNR
jgi:hypothetical protein